MATHLGRGIGSGLLVVAVLAIILFGFWHWGYRQGEASVTDGVVRVDTFTVRDTTWLPGKTVYVRSPIPPPVHTRDTVIVHEGVEVPVPINDYVTAYADTSMTAEFRHRVAGELLAFDFDYTPNIRTITETVTIDRVIVRRNSPLALSVDASALVADDVRLFLGPSLTWRPERRVALSYGPRWDLQERRLSHLVGVSVRVLGD